MTLSLLAAWTGVVTMWALAAFQLAVAAGAPLGQYVWGGFHTGRLPARFRLASLFATGLLIAFSLLLLERAGIFSGLDRPGIAGVAVWAMVALFALSTIGNLASRSPSEKKLMTPVAILLTVCCLIVALSFN